MINEKSKILIIDDDVQICDLLHDFLTNHGFEVVVTANDGKQMQLKLAKTEFDLIILDIMMPGDDGLTLCKELRKTSNIPIIMLSAIGEETDRIVGLEIGADDYLPKPFNPHELLARIKALLRRTNISGEARKEDDNHMKNIRFSGWVLDRNKRRLMTEDGLTIPLSSGEYDLLLTFIEHHGRVLTRDQLLDFTRGREGGPFDRTIDVQVGRLRKKIEDDLRNPKIIITVRGGGYQFTAKVEYL